jgi:hypothetical protein
VHLVAGDHADLDDGPAAGEKPLCVDLGEACSHLTGEYADAIAACRRQSVPMNFTLQTEHRQARTQATPLAAINNDPNSQRITYAGSNHGAERR